MDFETAKRTYVHRFTMEHIPNWAREPMSNGKFYAPQFRSDREWFDNTLFPPHKFQLSKRDTSCFTTGETWPLGQYLDAPYTKGAKS